MERKMDDMKINMQNMTRSTSMQNTKQNMNNMEINMQYMKQNMNNM